MRRMFSENQLKKQTIDVVNQGIQDGEISCKASNLSFEWNEEIESPGTLLIPNDYKEEIAKHKVFYLSVYSSTNDDFICLGIVYYGKDSPIFNNYTGEMSCYVLSQDEIVNNYGDFVVDTYTLHIDVIL